MVPTTHNGGYNLSLSLVVGIYNVYIRIYKDLVYARRRGAAIIPDKHFMRDIATARIRSSAFFVCRTRVSARKKH